MKNLFTLFLTLFFISVSNGQTEKATINTSRSNTKGSITKPDDSLQQKANHNTARSNKNTIKGDGGSPADDLPEKANSNTSRSNIKKIVNKPNDSLNNGDTASDKSKKVKFKAGAELSDKVK
jgi:hypothetical protein